MTLLFAFAKFSGFSDDITGLDQRLILPGILLSIRLFYAIPDIGNALGTTITFLDSIGINGLPAIALILLAIIGIINFASNDKLWGEVLKIIAGFTTGSFAQKATVSINKKRKQS